MAAVVPVLSFCATNLNTRDRLEASLASVAALGSTVDGSYEVVIAEGPSDDGATEWLTTESGGTRGSGSSATRPATAGTGGGSPTRRAGASGSCRSTRASCTGSSTGHLLARFAAFGSTKMLFSEICALPRAAVDAAGGWRDLVGGEDVDLYARVISEAGVVAYPTGAPKSQSATLGSYARQMRYVRGAGSRGPGGSTPCNGTRSSRATRRSAT